MNIQWYPGHMTKAKRMMQENIKLIDMIIELVDARVPYSSKNPDINGLAHNKPRLIALNKVDLADTKKTKQWEEWYKEQGYSVVLINSKKGQGVNNILQEVRTVCKEKIERDRKRGIINRPIRAMVVGIPNVGKSTFINKLVGKASAKTGNRPGVTKGKQWIKLKKDIELLDTPGILWPKFEDQVVGKRLAIIGSIKDDLLDTQELALFLITYLKETYQGLLYKQYGVEESLSPFELLNQMAALGHIKKAGDEYDLIRTANRLLDDCRDGKLGTITLEVPDDMPVE